MDYFAALAMAGQERDSGRIVAYSVDWTPDTGKRIFFEDRESGWCPYPAWVEFEDETPAGVPDYLND